jgi:hypothetical protein
MPALVSRLRTTPLKREELVAQIDEADVLLATSETRQTKHPFPGLARKLGRSMNAVYVNT